MQSSCTASLDVQQLSQYIFRQTESEPHWFLKFRYTCYV